MEEDIRRKGTLYLHQQRFGRRWRKVWCVLLAEGRRSVARLELYEHKQASIKGSSKRKPDYKQVIRLRECIRITDSEMADRPKDCGAFLLETTDKLYVFAAHLSEVKGWIRSLCEQAFPDVEAEQRSQREACMCSEPAAREMHENSLYDTAENVRDFLVIAVGTEAAVRCNLYGDYILTPLVDCLLLKDVKTKKVLYKWPYCYVRKFGQDMLSFSFEAGRRCESGEGNFEFATHQGERLFNVISAAIQNLPRPSAAKPASLDHQQQSVDHETVDETYDDTTVSQVSDFLPDVSKPSKMLNPAWRSFSMNAMEPQMESQESNVDLENQEPVYATVSKPPLKPTSPTDPKTHWQNLKKAVHQSPSFFTSDIPQFDFPIPCEDEVDEETEDAEVSADLLFDSIQQLSISETLKNIDEEAIYADPQDVEPKAEWAVSDVYDELEEVRKADGMDHQIEQDFNFSSDVNATLITTAPENTPNPEMFSVYDNFRLRRL